MTSRNTTNLRCHFEAVHGSKIKTEKVSDKRKSTQIPLNLEPRRLRVDPADGPSSTSGCSSVPHCSSTADLNSISSTSSTLVCKDPNVSISSKELTSKTTESIKDFFDNVKSFQEGGRKHSKLTDKILFMICKDSQPVATVEREGFKELMKHIAPTYKMPCRKTFARRLDEKYEKLSKDYKKI